MLQAKPKISTSAPLYAVLSCLPNGRSHSDSPRLSDLSKCLLLLVTESLMFHEIVLLLSSNKKVNAKLKHEAYLKLRAVQFVQECFFRQFRPCEEFFEEATCLSGASTVCCYQCSGNNTSSRPSRTSLLAWGCDDRTSAGSLKQAQPLDLGSGEEHQWQALHATAATNIQAFIKAHQE